MDIKGHKFQDLDEALEAMNLLNTYWGLPVTNGISQFGVWSLEVHPSEKFWWCHASEWTHPLGESEDIIFPEIFI